MIILISYIVVCFLKMGLFRLSYNSSELKANQKTIWQHDFCFWKNWYSVGCATLCSISEVILIYKRTLRCTVKLQKRLLADLSLFDNLVVNQFKHMKHCFRVQKVRKTNYRRPRSYKVDHVVAVCRTVIIIPDFQTCYPQWGYSS